MNTSTPPLPPLEIPGIRNWSADGSQVYVVIGSRAPGVGLINHAAAFSEAEALVRERLDAAGVETQSREAVQHRERVDELEKAVGDSEKALALCQAKLDELQARRRVLELEKPDKNFGNNLAKISDEIEKANDEKELAKKSLHAVVGVLEKAAREAETAAEAGLGAAYNNVLTSVQEEIDETLVQLADAMGPLLRRWIVLNLAATNRLSSLCSERRKHFEALEYSDLLARVQELERRLNHKLTAPAVAATA